MLLARIKARPVLPLFIAAHFSHHFAINGVSPLLPWIRAAFQLDYSRSGLLVSALPFLSGFAQLPVAGLADKWSKTRVIGLGLVGVSIGAIALSLAPSYNVLFAFLVVIGVFASTYHAPTSSFLSQYFSQEARGRALGTHAIGGSASLFATPAAAVLIATYMGDWRYSFAALAIPAFITGILVLSQGRRYEKESAARMGAGPKERFSIVETLRLIGLLVLLGMIASLIASTVSTYLSLYFVDKHEMPMWLAGMLPGVINAAGIVGAPLGGTLSDRVGRKPVIILSIIFAGPLLLLLTAVPRGSLTVVVPVMLVILLAYGLTWSARFPTMESLIADTVPYHRRASVMAAYFFMGQETGAVTSPLVGLFSDSYGLDAAFKGIAFLAMAASVLVVIIRNRL